jgi:hypothetical protein
MGASFRLPVGMIAKGAVAGALGTLAMDLLWYRRYRKGGGRSDFATWEMALETKSYDEAAAPAQVGKKVADTLGIELPPESAAVVTDVVHWATGVGWGNFHGLATAVTGWPSLLVGPLTGTVAWSVSYATLAPLGIYKPIWEYDAETLWKDLSAHLVFGAVMGLALRAMTRSN